MAFEIVWKDEMKEPRGMPARASSFIGRKKEMGELRRQLAHTRLLTVLGPGGAGKTRLATELARHQAGNFVDGSLLVELAEVRDGALVADAVARAAGITVQKEDTLAALSHRLGDRQLLLVVDNCEHLVADAAAVVARLLTDCAQVTVLATSRERLNLDGETSWRLPPLMLPGVADTLGAAAVTDSVRLFVDRARSVRPGFDLEPENLAAVVAICRKLDGIPLAIELAAARTAALSPADIVARLDDRLRLLTGGTRDADERHRTVRATLDWSYQLLEPAEQALLQRLSVFAGSFQLDAAQAVCGFDPFDPSGVLDLLHGLVDKSMVQAEAEAEATMRYRVLETVREYGAERLTEGGAADLLRDRHLAFYSRLARQAFEARMKRGAMAEFRRLWADMTDVRQALEWAREDLDAEVEFLGNLKQLWMIFAPAEGLRRLLSTLSGIDYKPTRGYVRALWSTQALLGRSGLHEQSLTSPQFLAELAIEAGEEALIPTSYFGEAYRAERLTRDLDAAREWLERAVAGCEQTGDLPDMAMALASLGGIEMQQGNLEAAGARIARALEVAREADDDYGVIGALFTHGWLEILTGDTDAAQGSFSAALELVGENDLLSVAEQAEGIAAAGITSDPVRAVTLFGAASALRDQAGTPATLPWTIWTDPAIAQARLAMPAESADKAWAAGRAMKPAQVRALALARRGPKAGPATAPGGLSGRELEVARLVTEGLTSRAIAERLFISERTVESHLDHILAKLGVNTRSQVAAWVAERGLAGGKTG